MQRPRGTRDIVPPDSRLWQWVEQQAREVFASFGAEEIRTPIFEHTELFVRSVGESTDIVHKEMYTFTDRKGRSLTLRPEGTAGVARAFLENRLADRPLPQRLYYLGPMFRYERMQRGRFRQFWQLGLEIIGADSPLADAECLAVLHELFWRLGFENLVFHLNNLGDPEDRPHYGELVRQALTPHRERLCADCQRRLEENALRVLDCKVEGCQGLVSQLPAVEEVASEASRAHVAEVLEHVERLGIPYQWNPRLVRGLDYSVRTVFEVVSPALGPQAVVCGGGRYDRLLADLGGPPLPGVGFAVGEDRLVELLPQEVRRQASQSRRLYVVPLGEAAAATALVWAREWVRQGVTLELELLGRSLKAALKRANHQGFSWVAMVGEEEVARQEVTVKELASGQQWALPWQELPQKWKESRP